MFQKGRLYTVLDEATMEYIVVRTEEELKNAAEAILISQHEGAEIQVVVNEVNYERMQVMCNVLFLDNYYNQDEDIDFDLLLTLEEYKKR